MYQFEWQYSCSCNSGCFILGEEFIYSAYIPNNVCNKCQVINIDLGKVAVENTDTMECSDKILIKKADGKAYWITLEDFKIALNNC